jgi:GGDEF domain-containing protein
VNVRLRIYGYVVGGVFWAALAAGLALNHGVHSFSKLAPLVALAVAGEELVVRQRESGGAAAISFSAVAHVAAALLLNPLDAAATAALGIVIADGLRSDGRRFLLLNSAMFGISTWAAAFAYRGLGEGTAHLTPRTVVALVTVLAVRYAITTSIFCGGIALAGGGRFFGMLAQASVEEMGSAAGEGSLGVLVAAGAMHDTATLPFLVPLFAALYASKANLERLRTETQRALNAMADVIDARDPSTTAHSERVAEYVARFVEALQLPPETADQLIATARYHDLGKIAVDVRTLTSSERLSEAELEQIRQHPRLSAQLLRPFSFAQDMAEFAELHHERFDGCGYYGAAGESVPIEAHVLIVVDSFDAMTSDRPYRPALRQDEAIEELLDKSGSQFHPLVARAFAAVVAGEPIAGRLTAQEISMLRSQFRRPAAVSVELPPLWQPRTALIAFVVIALGLAGLGSLPTSAHVAPLVAAALAGLAWAWTAERQRRRRRRAARALALRLSAEVVLAEAGFAGSGGWLALDPDAVTSTSSPGLSAPARAEAQSRARRRDDSGAVRLASGPTVVFSGIARDGRHYVLALTRPLRRSERELAQWVATELAARPDEVADARSRTDDKRRSTDRRVVALVDLGCFDRVRRGAGQLVAERVVVEVERALRSTLRYSDAIIRLGDDSFGISALVGAVDDVERLERRIAGAIAAVKLPARLEPLSPRIVAETSDSASTVPELAAIEAKLLPLGRLSEPVR